MSDKETNVTKTLGQVIDEIISALKYLDEESRITAISAVCQYLNIQLTEKPGIQSIIRTVENTPEKAPTTLIDIRTLKDQKQPSSAIEMAALVAFYLSELAPDPDRENTVETDDLVKYFKQADFPLPKTPEDLLPNAKKAGYFDSAGRGRYKLNPVGYNLVAHNLPRAITNKTAKPFRSRKKKRESGKTITSKK